MKLCVAAWVAGLLCAIMGFSAVAEEARIFKTLRLEGNGVRWKAPGGGEPRTVSYGIATGDIEFQGARNCGRMTALGPLLQASNVSAQTVHEEVAAAFAMWQDVANIRFREAIAPEQPDILIGAQAEPEGWAFANVFYDVLSPEPIKPISRALICLNPERRWKVGFDGNLRAYDLRYTIAHEVGHAIGLDHPNSGGQIMGYRYEETFRGLQTGDIAGAVLLYGKSQPQGVAAASQPPTAGPAEAIAPSPLPNITRGGSRAAPQPGK